MSSRPDTAAADAARRAHVAELTRELFRQASAVASGIADASGLHATDLSALRALDAAAGGPVTVSRLGAELGLTSGAVTALVDRLERHGLVRRRRDEADRRRVHVELTPAARVLGAELLRPIARRIGQAVEDLDADALQAVERFLAAVVGPPADGTP